MVLVREVCGSQPRFRAGAQGVRESAALQSWEQLASQCSGCRGLVATLRSSDLGSPGFPPGNYRTQLYDKQREEYQPATPGLGMFVEVKDPEDKVSPPLCPAKRHAVRFSARPGRHWFFPSYFPHLLNW